MESADGAETLRMTSSEDRTRMPVAVLGATGSVGQRMVALLDEHPWFETTALMASERSAGRPYREAATWVQPSAMPAPVADMVVQPTQPDSRCRLVFSALDASVAGAAELAFARAGHFVVSNARNHRMEPSVPLIVPEVNPDHLDLVRSQSFGPGAIVTNPNCSTIGLVLALGRLHSAFGVRQVHVVTMQAISGAGLPGVSSMEIMDNVIPFIGGEEEKMERETRKILGRFAGDRVLDADVLVSAQCNRVPVVDGHTECVSVALENPAAPHEIIAAWNGFVSEPQSLGLPTAPAHPVHYLTDVSAPQPRLHRDVDRGMAASIGRLRPCPLLDYKFVVLSHNTIRGAAGGAILLAELAVARGLVATAG